jgi:hypothetical protein
MKLGRTLEVNEFGIDDGVRRPAAGEPVTMAA